MTGGPALIIADAAAKESADVIVTGTRGHTALAGVFLGSVAQRLLHVAGCPVLVVPDMAPAGAASAGAKRPPPSTDGEPDGWVYPHGRAQPEA